VQVIEADSAAPSFAIRGRMRSPWRAPLREFLNFDADAKALTLLEVRALLVGFALCSFLPTALRGEQGRQIVNFP
jgi:hypothetical protein